MISTVAWVAGAGCGVTAAPGRTRPSGALPAAARVHTAVQPDMQHGTFGGARTLVLPTARRRTCSRPPARLPPCAAKGSDSDLEVEILEKQGFQGLASAVANKLASGLAQQEGGLNRIGRWLEAGAKEARAQEAQPEEPGETGAPPGLASSKARCAKAASIVGGVLGAPGAVRGWVSEQSPVAAAAHYLGVDSVNLNVDTLKGWLTNPKRKDDVKMVGALVYKMLQSLEAETGEPFKGKDHQYRLLYTLATELFGGSVKARVVRALVDSFIKVASR